MTSIVRTMPSWDLMVLVALLVVTVVTVSLAIWWSMAFWCKCSTWPEEREATTRSTTAVDLLTAASVPTRIQRKRTKGWRMPRLNSPKIGDDH